MKNFKIPCEIYSRAVGYFRPVSTWNKGKRREFELRHTHSPKDLKEQLKKKEAEQCQEKE